MARHKLATSNRPSSEARDGPSEVIGYFHSAAHLLQATVTVIALGIDPGTLNLGWGVVARHGNKLNHVAHGIIRLSGKEALAMRLTRIEHGLSQVLEEFRPSVSSVETLFFHKDAQAAAKLGHARGVVLLSLARAGIEVFEYAPAKVKRTVAGGGRADKRQVAMMMQALLGLEKLPGSDATDALALAVTHLRVGTASQRLAEASQALQRRSRAHQAQLASRRRAAVR
jgi:crossover junction endodeoxyribonuclease RuvC